MNVRKQPDKYENETDKRKYQRRSIYKSTTKNVQKGFTRRQGEQRIKKNTIRGGEGEIREGEKREPNDEDVEENGGGG